MASVKFIFIVVVCILLGHSLDARPAGAATRGDHQKPIQRQRPLHQRLTRTIGQEATVPTQLTDKPKLAGSSADGSVMLPESIKITIESPEEVFEDFIEVACDPRLDYHKSCGDLSKEDPLNQLYIKSVEPDVTDSMQLIDRAELPDLSANVRFHPLFTKPIEPKITVSMQLPGSSADSIAMPPGLVTITIEPVEEESGFLEVVSDPLPQNYNSGVDILEEGSHHYCHPRLCRNSVYPEQEENVY